MLLALAVNFAAMIAIKAMASTAMRAVTMTVVVISPRSLSLRSKRMRAVARVQSVR